ncbi:reverse transcriptase domain-containing protein [Tanacetum coccineum]|uniref:Reverse transcriptase domain-containing protein n=1 Tax=Tanacetum coccineum TaxID=301880 RepID=A0ABQ5AUD2_9ASTR
MKEKGAARSVMNLFLLIGLESRKLGEFYTIKFSNGHEVKAKDIIIANIKHTIELADRKLVGVDTILKGCTLNLLNHPFNIDLILVELGSFNVIIGMDWLTKYYTVIICDEKLIRFPFGNETLSIRGDRIEDRRDSRLSIISCPKAKKCIQKGCHVSLEHITMKKKTKKKSKEK